MKQQNDTLWKVILEHFFYDFLLLIDPDLAATININKEITFMDKELNQQRPADGEKFELKIVDKLVKLYTTEGNDEWILVHLEVQHQYQKNFSKRMYGYYNRLYDRYHKPITAYAIFTEPNLIKRDNVYQTTCGRTALKYTFNTYKVALQDDDFLRNHANPFALVVLIAKQTDLKKKYKNKKVYDQMLLDDKLSIAKLIFDRHLPDVKEKELINFLFHYVNFEFSETQAKFEQGINLLTNKNISKMTIQQIVLGQRELIGKRKGIKIGERKAKEEVVARMLEMKMLSEEQIIEMTEVTPKLVSRIRKKLEKVH